jgi:hypothetical protein
MIIVYTVREAKQKWCPFSSAPVQNGPSVSSANRLSEDYRGRNGVREACACLADDCMGWCSVSSGSAVEARGYCGYISSPSARKAAQKG